MLQLLRQTQTALWEGCMYTYASMCICETQPKAFGIDHNRDTLARSVLPTRTLLQFIHLLNLLILSKLFSDGLMDMHVAHESHGYAQSHEYARGSRG